MLRRALLFIAMVAALLVVVALELMLGWGMLMLFVGADRIGDKEFEFGDAICIAFILGLLILQAELFYRNQPRIERFWRENIATKNTSTQ